MQLEGKKALVTGGGRGIGRSIALAYAREGADVAVVSRTGAELEEVTNLVRGLGRKGLSINAELTNSDEVSRAVKETIEALGTVDILVNNAGGYRLFTDGLSHQVSVADITEEEWQRVIHSNLTTTFLSCKAVLPHMMERGGGSIINLTSRNVARKGRAGAAAYGAAKAGLVNMGATLAHEWGPGIRVLTLTVGMIVTEDAGLYYGGDDGIAAVGANLAMRRMGDPAEVADMCLVLASPLARWMTGTNVEVHGGGEGLYRPGLTREQCRQVWHVVGFTSFVRGCHGDMLSRQPHYCQHGAASALLFKWLVPDLAT